MRLHTTTMARRSLFKLHLQVQVFVVRHYIQTARVQVPLLIKTKSRHRDSHSVVIKYFGVSKCVRDYQIQNLVEKKFVEIFGRTKQILST